MASKMPSGSWRVRWIQDGLKKSQVFPNRELANKFESQLKLNLVRKDILGEKCDAPFFGEFSDRWLKEYCQIEKARSQWVGDESVIRIHLKPAFGDIKLSNLKRSDLLTLKQELRLKTKPGKSRKHLSPKSINNILVLVKKMMSTAVEWELISANPFADVRPIKQLKQPFSYWTPNERDKFLEQCKSFDPEFYRAVLVVCHTGLRLGELAGLKWESVDFHRRMITVKESYSYRLKAELAHTKNMDFADIPMNQLVYNTLQKMKLNAAGPTIFENSLLQSACHRLQHRCKLFGIKPIRFHDLRHTFASCLAMAGIDLMVIKELLRHKSYQMTLRYAHLHPDYLRGKTEILCQSGPSLDHDDFKKISGGPRLDHDSKKGKIFHLPLSR